MTSVKHCCDLMNTHVGSYDDYIRFSSKYREYTIPIHDGGSSGVVIHFCPWCSARLPSSLRCKSK